MEPTTAAAPTTLDEGLSTDIDGHTRRTFIRGIAAAGASTVGAAALDATGFTSLLEDTADAATGAPGPFGEFEAIAASSADAFEVPAGYRADVLIKWDDVFANTDGTTFTFGYNNDWLAYYPIDGSNEGLLFVNHEYPAPFFEHGNTNAAAKTNAQIAQEQEAVGNAIIHIKKNAAGLWAVVTPSPYSRRITGNSPLCSMTGPLAGTVSGGLDVGTTAKGSLANCSGGTTPWGTALSCEENYADYASTSGFGYGWTNDPEYNSTTFAKYGWVVETDPYDPTFQPRKHTALGRFRHENTAFRVVTGKKFVLYMGDDRANEGVYKFISDREYLPGNRAHNLQILEGGQLYIAKWTPNGRRQFSSINGPLTTATSGTGEWIAVNDDELAETAARLRTRLTAAEFTARYATNRPEDVEVESSGSVLVAFTNNSGVNDVHGLVRRMTETGNDPEALTFDWADYANGGEKGRPNPGEKGFSSADNLTFDTAENLWVVTDISSSALQGSTSPAAHYAYHKNNAVFMIPRTGPNRGVAFRFANMPIESEGTGPYFTPDDSTLFIAVQHPGEETATPSRNAVFGQPETYTSYWPAGNKTTGQNPSTPRPAVVAITKVAPADPPGNNVIPPPPAGNTTDTTDPKLELDVNSSKVSDLLKGLDVEVKVDEPCTVDLVLKGKVPGGKKRGKGNDDKGRRAQNVTVGQVVLRFDSAGSKTATFKPQSTKRAIKKGGKFDGTLVAVATDRAGNKSTVREPVKLK